MENREEKRGDIKGVAGPDTVREAATVAGEAERKARRRGPTTVRVFPRALRLEGVKGREDALRETLRASQMFCGLGEAELKKIAQLAQEKGYEAGDVIFTEGVFLDHFYIITEGKVALEKMLSFGAQWQRKATIDVITPGQALGASALGERQMSTSSARCLVKTKVIAIEAQKLRLLLEADATLGMRILHRAVDVFRGRFLHATDRLAHILAIASHDLKAPLGAAESYLQVTLGGFAGELNEKQRNMLLRSSERIRSLLNLIDDILDISRIDAAEWKLEPTSLNKVVESCLENVRPQAQNKDIHLQTQLPAEDVVIPGAAGRLEQAITNLVSNAVKYTPPGGKVTLQMRSEDGTIRLEVMDTGIGIPPEDLPRIFDDFYRGSNVDSKGAGLGLSIARKIVEAHGGRIWAESPYPEEESGKGSKFTVLFPQG